MTTTQISAEPIGQLLDSLYSGEVTVKSLDSALPIAEPRVVATYVDNDGHMREAIVCDLAIANSLGAALTMIPARLAEDSVAAGEVPENIAANLHEVFNIAASLFVRSGAKRIVLNEVLLPGQPVSEEAQAILAAAGQPLHMEVEIERYPAGQITLLSAD